MQFTGKSFAIFSTLYYLSILQYLVSVITPAENIIDENTKICCISLLKVLLYTACSLLRLGANSKQVYTLAPDHFTKSKCLYNLQWLLQGYSHISTSFVTAFSHSERQGKETLSKAHPCRIFLNFWKTTSARMSVVCGSGGQLMLSHNATAEPSALDPSVLLKHYLRTRDGVRLYPLFNRWHIVVWNEQTDPFLHSSLLFPASCLCIELKLNEVHLALHPVCVENSFRVFMWKPLSQKGWAERKKLPHFSEKVKTRCDL